LRLKWGLDVRRPARYAARGQGDALAATYHKGRNTSMSLKLSGFRARFTPGYWNLTRDDAGHVIRPMPGDVGQIVATHNGRALVEWGDGLESWINEDLITIVPTEFTPPADEPNCVCAASGDYEVVTGEHTRWCDWSPDFEPSDRQLEQMHGRSTEDRYQQARGQKYGTRIDKGGWGR
jgi:hypothetical protein